MSRLVPTLALVALAACSDDANTTTGRRIVLRSSATPQSTAAETMATGFGWDVTLTKAAVATSGLYYFDGPPPTAMFRMPEKRGLGERFASLFIGTAHAHPGHYAAGNALGQLLLPTATTIDLFANAPIALGEGDAITGTYRSARFVFPSAGPGDALLGGHLAVAEGKALKRGEAAAQPIYFRLVADLADISQYINNGAVDGCVLDEAVVSGNGAVTFTVAPKIWLALVDFSKIAPGTELAPTEARDAGFSQGITQLSAYRFNFTPDAQ